MNPRFKPGDAVQRAYPPGHLRPAHGAGAADRPAGAGYLVAGLFTRMRCTVCGGKRVNVQVTRTG